jgi:hypothetical protein
MAKKNFWKVTEGRSEVRYETILSILPAQISSGVKEP